MFAEEMWFGVGDGVECGRQTTQAPKAYNIAANAVAPHHPTHTVAPCAASATAKATSTKSPRRTLFIVIA